MKVQSPTDEFNPLRAVSSVSDFARSNANTELHFYSPFIILVIVKSYLKTNLFYLTINKT